MKKTETNTKSRQKVNSLLKKNVENLLEHIEKFMNPFMEESKYLLVLDTKEIACKELVKTAVNMLEELGKNICESYLQEGHLNKTNPVSRCY